MGVSISGGTPFHHPFSIEIFPNKNHLFGGNPMAMENPHTYISIYFHPFPGARNKRRGETFARLAQREALACLTQCETPWTLQEWGSMAMGWGTMTVRLPWYQQKVL